ncbi:MAG: inositol monophosphatase [Patescibacteria group bacterium]|nr:inositol monophosphatase [Patescibacteria group bacterium]
MEFLDLAREAAEKAGKTAMSYFKKEHTFHHKGEPSNFCTEADLHSEKVIFELVKKHFPKHSFLSEEMGLVNNGSEYTWVVDPIDGTVNFSHGQPLWGVEIAVFKNNMPFIGVVYLPVLNELYFAQKGQGAFLNGEKIGTSRTKKLESSLIGLEVNYPAGRKVQKFPFEKFIRNIPAVLGMSASTAFDLVAIARGGMDGFVEEEAYIWDIAGGMVLVEEAGGKVTDWKGKALVWKLDTEKLYQHIASNGILHTEILERFKSYL